MATTTLTADSIQQAINAAQKTANDALAAAGTVAANTKSRVATIPARPGPSGLNGINLAGAEFTTDPNPANSVLPGTLGTHYNYPTQGYINMLAGRGFGFVRLPIRHERLQLTLGAALDGTRMAAFVKVLDQFAAAGMRVVIDLHNYARFQTPPTEVVLGSAGYTAAQFADFWGKLAGALKNHPAVFALGLMNEPTQMAMKNATDDDVPLGLSRWETASQAAVTAIRQAGFTGEIWVAGYNWSSVAGWVDTHGATGWITDPMNNFRYEGHYYVDSGSRGGGSFEAADGSAWTVAKAQARSAQDSWPDLMAREKFDLDTWVKWGADNNARLVLGETGWPAGEWEAYGKQVLTLMAAAGIPVAYWAAGEFWGSYPLNPLPTTTTATAHAPMIQSFNGFPSVASPVATQAAADVAALKVKVDALPAGGTSTGGTVTAVTLTDAEIASLVGTV